MKSEIEILKGIHPGLILEKELKNRKIRKSRFALEINEYPQTISAITKCLRGMNTPLSIKIEERLGIEEGFFMTLQVFYDIKEEKKKLHQKYHPDLSKLRPVLFWDTSMDQIDWHKQKKAVIRRIFERGNDEEKNEIIHFYGKKVVADIIKPEAHT